MQSYISASNLSSVKLIEIYTCKAIHGRDKKANQEMGVPLRSRNFRKIESDGQTGGTRVTVLYILTEGGNERSRLSGYPRQVSFSIAK